MEMTQHAHRARAAPQRCGPRSTIPAVLKACIPGCESLERTSATTHGARSSRRRSARSPRRFTGRMQLTDIDPPNGYTLNFDGQGGAAGFANGEAKVALAPAEGGAHDADLHGEGAGRRQDRADRLAPGRRRRGRS